MESIPFITTTDEGEFQVDERAVEYLESIQGRVAIIAVAGPWRTGKSFLLNQLLGIQGAGFVVGPTINACTKGIWLWGHPIVLEDGLSVVLMDTEGLGSTSRSQNEDCNIFSLALLLSSYFIWNSRGVIDGNALEDFALVVNITKHIHVRSQAVQNLGGTGSAASNEIAQLSQYFPSFMWVVRDFSLKLEENGRAISDRQYLEKALKPQGGFTEDSASRNQIRHLLSSFFTERDCTTLVRPAEDESVLRNLMAVSLSDLRPEFAKAVNGLKKKVFGAVRPKILHGRTLSGPMIATLSRAYVTSINTGGAPTISTAWERVLETQAEQAMTNAISLYCDRIKEQLDIEYDEKGKPIINGLLLELKEILEIATAGELVEWASKLPLQDDELVTCHESCAREAVEHFIHGCWGEEMKDALGKTLLMLRTRLGERLTYLAEANIKLSEGLSMAIATALFARDMPPPYTRRIEELTRRKGESLQIEDELKMGQEWLQTVYNGLIQFRDAYVDQARGPMRWAVFSTFLGDQVLALMVGWGQGVGGAQRRACSSLRGLLQRTIRGKEAAIGQLEAVRIQGERLAVEGKRTNQEKEARYVTEKDMVKAQIEAAAKRLQQSQDFLGKLEAAHELVTKMVNEQCDLNKSLAEEMRDTMTKFQTLPTTVSRPAGGAGDGWEKEGSDDEGEDNLWDIKAQVSAAEAELRLLRQEIDLKEQHLEANMRLLDIKEKELRDVEFNWGMTKASTAAEVDDIGEVEDEIACLYRIVRQCKDYLSWTTAFGKLPKGLTEAFSEQQQEIYDEA